VGELTWRAFDRGFTASPPGITERLRTIKEVDEARRAQADLRRASKEAVWEEADMARQKATAGLLKAIAALASAAAHVEREMRESGNLSSVAESLRNSALEDLRSAQAIGNELALLGQMALDQLREDPTREETRLEEGLPETGLKGGSISSQAPEDERLMSQPAELGLEIQRTPFTPEASEGDVTPPGVGGTGATRQREPREEPVSSVTASPVPPVVETGSSGPAASEEAETPPPPLVVETGEVSPMSAAEQLRREFAAGVHPPRSSEGAAPVSPTRGSGHRVEQPEVHLEPPQNAAASAAEELRREMAAPQPPVAGAQQPGGPIPMPASTEAAASEGGIAARSEAEDPGPDTYTGRLYVMFPSTLGQDDIGSIWEILENMVAGSIVENRLISREAGIQFTLDLGSKVFAWERLRSLMPGAKLAALGPDRLKVDWPPTG
jgi:hypothetical protein